MRLTPIRPLVTLGLIVAGLILIAQPAHAATVGVDYSQAAQDVFPGTTAENVGSNSVASPLTTNNIGDPTGGLAVVDVKIDSTDGNLQVRGGNGANNRTDLDPNIYPLADLAEELIIAQSGELEIVISGLPAGKFAFLGVFNDSFTLTQGFAFEAEFDIFLTDAVNTAVFQDNVLASNVDDNVVANSTDDTIATSTFTITSNGTDDVLIELISAGVGADGINSDGFIPLSGFTINVIPTPAALPAGLALLALSVMRRRRH